MGALAQGLGRVCMRAAILDTNVYRTLNDGDFAQLLAREAASNVYPVVDSWTILELLAGLARPQAREFGAYAAAVRRLADRSLRRNGHMVLPLEAQARKLLLDGESEELRGQLQFVADPALWAASVNDIGAVPELVRRCESLAERVQETEGDFGEATQELGVALQTALEGRGGSAKLDLRGLLRSEAPLEACAQVLIVRTLELAGHPVPEPIPLKLIAEVVRVFRNLGTDKGESPAGPRPVVLTCKTRQRAPPARNIGSQARRR